MNTPTQPRAAASLSREQSGEAAHTPTPRTDDATDDVRSLDYSDKGRVVYASFARTLERETIAQAKRIEELTASLSRLVGLFEADYLRRNGDGGRVDHAMRQARALLNRQP